MFSNEEQTHILYSDHVAMLKRLRKRSFGVWWAVRETAEEAFQSIMIRSGAIGDGD